MNYVDRSTHEGVEKITAHLIHAAQLGHANVISTSMQMEMGANINKHEPCLDFRALHEALKGRKEVAISLLDHGTQHQCCGQAGVHIISQMDLGPSFTKSSTTSRPGVVKWI